ncbi:MAG: glutaredoxin family protein [Nanoarchaeota archaeon]|nr:glutaredoxin family protein [Nanoarchaeota archaeon]MCG2717474.1 glutaredoxin family protein [Nanoarchaeota archaeon]
MKKVILYCVAGSVYSDMVKRLFKKYKIVYEEKRIDTDPEAMKELVEIVPDDGAPTIVIDGKIYKYFDEAELKKIFKIKD